MESDGLIDSFARVVFKISATLLTLCVILLLWLRSEGVGKSLLLVVIGINAVTVLSAAAVIRFAAKRSEAVQKTAIIDVLEQNSSANEAKGEANEA